VFSGKSRSTATTELDLTTKWLHNHVGALITLTSTDRNAHTVVACTSKACSDVQGSNGYNDSWIASWYNVTQQ